MASRRHRGVDLSLPASKEPIPATKLVGLLHDVAESLYPATDGRRSRSSQLRYNAFTDAIRRLETFLSHGNIESVSLDEKLLRDFAAHLDSIGVSDGYVRIYRCTIVRLLNKLPSSYLQRKLVSVAEANRKNRFASFTAPSQEAFEMFLRDGRKLKRDASHDAPELSNELLSDLMRSQIANGTLTLMKAIGASDLLALTEGDIEEFIDIYEERGSRGTALKLMDYIRPLFSNLIARGLIKENPLRSIPRQKTGVNLDYVDQESIDKLADLSTVDMDDFKDVRGRLLSFSLDYDYALRNRESSLVRCSDFNGVELHLRREIQKVKKDTLPIYSYFPETTGPLLKRYMELRAMKAPKTDILMIACDGSPLGVDGCRGAVRAHCAKLGIKTHEGKPVVPHRLRHSFGTLNIEPLGIGLGIIEVKEQLRHSTIQTTYDIYIARNLLHAKKRYEARMAKVSKILGRVSNAPVEPVHAESVQARAVPPPAVPAEDAFVSETEAWQRVRSLGLGGLPLRRYALKVGKAQRDGRGYVYAAVFIDDIATNYFTREEAIDLLQMAPSTFFDWTQKDGIEFLLINRISLFRKDVIMEKRRQGRGPCPD